MYKNIKHLGQKFLKKDQDELSQKNVVDGFTIVELIVVIVVIIILSVLTMITYNGVQNQAIQATLSSDLEQSFKKINLYKIENNDQYPLNLLAAVSDAGIKHSSNVEFAYFLEPSASSICIEAQSTINTNLIKSVSTFFPIPSDGHCSQSKLVGWWSLNGNVDDSSGLNNGGSIFGTVLPAIGWNNATDGSYQFNGSSSVRVPDSGSLGLDKLISMTGWVYFDDGAMGVYQGIVSKLSGSYELNKSSDDALRVEMICNGNHRGYETTGSLTELHRWYFVVGTFDSSNGDITLYVDGLPKPVTYLDTHSGCNDIQVSSSPVVLAGRASGGLRLYGRLDDVRIYNRILTDTEVAKMYIRGAY